MPLLQTIRDALLHLAFPHLCAGCGSDLLPRDQRLCLHCLDTLPQTQFHLYADNPVSRKMSGRLPLAQATAQYYFTKDSALQQLLHQAKYKGDKDLCIYLGRLMGQQLAQSSWITTIEALVPLPLHPRRERQRGYNQAKLLCQGIADVLSLPVLADVVTRPTATESQTRKNRVERWENMEGRFSLINADRIAGRHLLLVDDVITTGATLESCGRTLLQAPDTQLSIATLCFSAD